MVLVVAYQLPVFMRTSSIVLFLCLNVTLSYGLGRLYKESSARENEQSCLRALECFQLSFIGLGICGRLVCI